MSKGKITEKAAAIYSLLDLTSRIYGYVHEKFEDAELYLSIPSLVAGAMYANNQSGRLTPEQTLDLIVRMAKIYFNMAYRKPTDEEVEELHKLIGEYA